MKRNPKHYPMDGPSLVLQRLMQSPRANREAIKQCLKSEKACKRDETLAILELV
jgi:hypothetical protein